ncbi:ribosome quality control complex subunit NEMF homolog [Neocloeon triangulifer]|uniref:ribosome quality control complex subunit NEMF homolog n=1 Tax=Neocloeon triangulifer TaxID=2078957 RepID=UPI00286F7363|nr:ribosome quality control complex subunit NEMF homolog [Neocloeon triangulifer]
MKNRFNSLDLVCSVVELQKVVGLRLQQVYDIDHRTYLLKLQEKDDKAVLLIESGNRIHTTAFEWPKNMAPSSFSMKMRKHLKNKRLESLTQLGIDRAIDLQFGTGPAAYHLILELYDRGNIILTDCDFVILNVLRPHTEGEQIRFAVKEKYPQDRARTRQGAPDEERLKKIFSKAKPGDQLKKFLVPNTDYGPALIEHVLLGAGFPPNVKFGKDFNLEENFGKIHDALCVADEILNKASTEPSKGYVIQKKEAKVHEEGEILTNVEFHSMLFKQNEGRPYKEFPSFDAAVDEFFSSLEGQKIELKALQQERDAMKKLDNVKKDHDQRLKALSETQESDRNKAELITRNHDMVDHAILVVRSALAKQMSWPDVARMVQEAKQQNDPVASAIVNLKLEVNNITMRLADPYSTAVSDDEGETGLQPTLIDIDLDLNAHSNARKYYDQRRSAAKKQQKTVKSQKKALKSAEKKTKQTLKDVQTATSIQKVRKVFWFEKFFWFISSENYLVVGGRDQQQNELVVRRYLRAGDIYVHADLQGASSIVIKNPSGDPVPPKTLNEAGIMAICYSVAWEAKVTSGAWWVISNQVSKTAPTGEYLTTGSFMVRGKRNYLPPTQLAMGFGFLFKLEESSVARHVDERKIRTTEEEEDMSEISSVNDQEIELEGPDEEGDEPEATLENLKEMTIKEEPEENEPAKSESDEEDQDNSEEGEDNVASKSKQIEFPDTELKLPLLGELTSGTQLADTDTFVIGKSVSIPKKTAKKDVDKEAKAEAAKQYQQQQQMKRGQRGKLKKLKEKYKDQDEEERQLRMQILHGVDGGKAKKDKGKKESEKPISNKQKQQAKKPKAGPFCDRTEFVPDQLPPDEAAELDTEAAPVTSDLETLNSLTGLPVAEDELLFAVPVVAPYNTLTNYKYKVKLMPGTGKRGKAAKTSLAIFLRDKTCSQREKDLLKSVKEQDLARNFPGKVRLSAPQMLKSKK